MLATIVGAMGLADYFTAWLNILGVALPPVAGVIICDYYFLKGMKYEYGPGTVYCKVNLWAFISMVGGIVIGFTVHWGIASINSLAVSVVLHLVLMKTLGRGNSGMIGEETEV